MYLFIVLWNLERFWNFNKFSRGIFTVFRENHLFLQRTKTFLDMRKLVVTINDNAVMPRLRLAIRQLNGVERVATLRELPLRPVKKVEKTHQKFLQRIDSLSQLKDGWDGDGSKAIDTTCIKKIRRIITKIDETLLKGWVLFPDAHGYLYFDYTGANSVAGITLMPYKMVYFVQKGDSVQKNDGMDFTSANLISVLEQVNG